MRKRLNPTAGTTAEHARSFWRTVLRWHTTCRCGKAWPCVRVLDAQGERRLDAAELARRFASGMPGFDEPDVPRQLPRTIE
ncbi:MAG: hypothetical protein ACRD0P_18330 [Stackebrandtia sp.]